MLSSGGDHWEQVSEVKRAEDDMSQMHTKTTQHSNSSVFFTSTADTLNEALDLSKTRPDACTFRYDWRKTPIITSIFPNSGGVLTEVTITGEQFSTMKSSIDIKIGPATCNVLRATPTQVVCQVDEWAVTGTYKLKYHQAPQGSAYFSREATTPGTFTVLMSVNDISPSKVSLYGGTTVTVSGNGFGPRGFQNKLTFTNDELELTIPCVPKTIKNFQVSERSERALMNGDEIPRYDYSDTGGSLLPTNTKLTNSILLTRFKNFLLLLHKKCASIRLAQCQLTVNDPGFECGPDFGFRDVAYYTESTYMKSYTTWFDFSNSIQIECDLPVIDLGVHNHRAFADKALYERNAILDLTFFNLTVKTISEEQVSEMLRCERIEPRAKRSELVTTSVSVAVSLRSQLAIHKLTTHFIPTHLPLGADDGRRSRRPRLLRC